MSNTNNQMDQVRELLFGEQIQLIEARFKELSEKFHSELSDAKAALQADYDRKLSAMKQAFSEAERTINSNMVDRGELAKYFIEIATKLEKE